MKPAPKTPRRWLAILLMAAAVATLATTPLVAPSLSHAVASDWGPGFRSCGSFRAEYRIRVYANRRTRCRTARKVQREYWLAPPSRIKAVGSGPDSYVKLKRYPGWRCYSGAGGGSCRKGRLVAAYENGP